MASFSPKAKKKWSQSGLCDHVVEENGFEPLKPKQQIYSLPPLTTRELLHIQFEGWCLPLLLELVDGFEPPTC